MNKWGSMALTSFAISLMMVIAALAANTEGSLGSAGSTGSPGINNPYEGMSSSGWDYEFGMAPEYRSEEFDTSSDQEMSSSNWDHEFGLSPEYPSEDFNARHREEMSSDQDRDYGVYSVTPDKEPNAPY